jgi:hypothetical protein
VQITGDGFRVEAGALQNTLKTALLPGGANQFPGGSCTR